MDATYNSENISECCKNDYGYFCWSFISHILFVLKLLQEEKKALKKTESEDKDLLQRASLDITLLPEAEEDARLASLLKYKSTESMYLVIK